jgi:hypothetical protein
MYPILTLKEYALASLHIIIEPTNDLETSRTAGILKNASIMRVVQYLQPRLKYNSCSCGSIISGKDL